MDMTNIEMLNTKEPHSLDAEMSILGAMMLSKDALYKGSEMLNREDFFIESNRLIFDAIIESFNKRETADALTVRELLKEKSQLKAIGGEEYLANIIENVLSVALFDKHADIVLEKSLNRRVIQAAKEILNNAITEKLKGEELLDNSEQLILEIRERGVRKGFTRISSLMHPLIDYIERTRKEGKGITGLPSGFPDFDNMTAGFQNGDLIVLASRPSQGKTSLALTILHYLSVVEKIPTAFFSIEMSTQQIGLRLLCMEARVSMNKVRTGRLSSSKDMPALIKASEKLKEAPIYIDDTSGIPILELKAKARRIHREKGVKLVAVDYMQLIRAPRQENRQQEVSLISRELKGLAKELHIPVLAMSQLSRASEKGDKIRPPRLSDLRESGSIEQDADLVFFIYRPNKDDERDSDTEKVEIRIEKQRNGPIGRVSLLFFKPYTKFESMTRESDYSQEPIDENF